MAPPLKSGNKIASLRIVLIGGEQLRLILSFLAFIKVTQASGARPTHLATAAAKGYIDIVSVLLKHTIDINAQDKEGNTVLMWAVDGPEQTDYDYERNDEAESKIEVYKKNNKNLVAILLAHKADVNIQNHNGDTALIIAVKKDRKELISLLLESQADVSIKNKNGDTALLLSAEKWNKNSPTPLLLAYQATNQDINRKMTLMEAVILGRIDLVVNLLPASNTFDLNKALIAAISMGHQDIISLLFKSGANIDAVDSCQKTALIRAARIDDKDLVSQLIAYHADIHAIDTNSHTALMHAVRNGDKDMVMLLLQHGAIPDIGNLDQTPFEAALDTNRKDIAELLIKAGTRIRVGGSQHHNNSLIKAATRGYVDIVSLLVDHKAEIYSQDIKGNTVLMAAIQGKEKDVEPILQVNKNCKNIVSLLLDYNDINHQNNAGNTALMIAIEKNRTDIISLLLDKNPNLEIKNGNGYTAVMLATEMLDKKIPLFILSKKPVANWTLIEAAISGSKNVVEKFLNKNSNNKKNHEDINQALLFASSMGHKDIVSLLLQKGANINATDKYGFTPLVRAIYAGHRNIVSQLLAFKADVNIPDKFPENTPLMAAAAFGDVNIISQLIAYGADVNRENMRRDTPLKYAVYHNHKDAALLLLKNNADVNAEGREGNTALRSAVGGGDKEMVSLLLQHGAEVNPEDSYASETILGIAVNKNRADIAELLIKSGAEISN